MIGITSPRGVFYGVVGKIARWVVMLLGNDGGGDDDGVVVCGGGGEDEMYLPITDLMSSKLQFEHAI